MKKQRLILLENVFFHSFQNFNPEFRLANFNELNGNQTFSINSVAKIRFCKKVFMLNLRVITRLNCPNNRYLQDYSIL